MSSTYKTYLVGGAVRDQLLGHPFNDYDWVVVGATPQLMIDAGFRPVGQDFPVFLHPETGEEYALARTERKSGQGYGGFTFHASPNVTLEQDLIRRDLTINAMAMDDDCKVIDPYGGQRDLAARVLRHVSPAFVEDPMRVLRIARYAARYDRMGFTVAPDTMALMGELARSGELKALTAERSWKEISRALMEPNPEIFIRVLRDCGALAELLPEVDRLFGVPQPKAHHPEVDTGEHLLLVLQAAAKMQLTLPARWACLLHDLGKGLTDPAHWPKHHGHETKGLAAVKAVNKRCKAPRDCQELALLTCEYHTHSHRALELKAGTLLKLFKAFDIYRRPERFEQFLGSCEADARGRTGLENEPYPQADYLRAAAQAARGVSVESLLTQRLEGAELGKGLEREREKAIAEFKASFPQG
ncbi:multifunctional CCA addition/repair protein [uncultured Halopseudomonas sp.]|uniref:multifunctional CCA addition/repair protein n=1 Tax=uncultured Halopseudomonas sp. TaxID=2901193 RepID=UPI0030EE7208|tara:strand:+ start:3024 stop:4268 length:1245 start_codon:yes stop_codon:yes gene_type:complete